MAHFADRVKDTTTTTGTGTLTLANSAPAGYQTFASGLGASQVVNVPYAIGSSGAEWEVGFGTFNGTTSLTRDKIVASSNSGSAVNLSAGTKDVWINAGAEMLNAGSIGVSISLARGWGRN
jgi:hypothetical protein